MKQEAVTKNQQFIKKNPEEDKIYFSYDEPLLTRRENARLRKVKKDLSEQNPGSNVQLTKGKLLLNNIERDSFNLKNQVF